MPPNRCRIRSDEPRPSRLARRDRDVGASLGEKSGGAHADRPCTGGDDRAPAVHGPTARCSLATAATAVVFEPFESSMTDTRSGPKNALRTAASSCSPAAMSVPPMKIGRVVQILGPAREDCAVHEIADRVLGRRRRSS